MVLSQLLNPEELWQLLQDASRDLQSYSTVKSFRHLCKNAVNAVQKTKKKDYQLTSIN